MIKKRIPEPNLVNPMVRKKIMDILAPPKEDYWEPTRNTLKIFFYKYIMPNIFWVFVFIIICIFLYYRYRDTQKKKQKELENPVNTTPNIDYQRIIDKSTQMYRANIEDLREKYVAKKKPAYPVYPYGNGTLTPNKSHK